MAFAQEGVDVDFEVGDAEAMTYDDATFDVVTSTCGRHVRPRPPRSRAWDLFSTSYGPTKSAVDALEPARREEFQHAWIEFGDQYLEDGRLVHRREYRLTLGTRR